MRLAISLSLVHHTPRGRERAARVLRAAAHLVRSGEREGLRMEVVVGKVRLQPRPRVAVGVDRDEDGQHLPSGAVEAVEHLGHLPCVRGSKGAE